MKKTSGALALILFAILSSIAFGTALAPVRTEASTSATSVADYPVRIVAPSIKLDSPIQGVGVNAKGEMAVPSGKTNTVGWYAYGAKPGQTGTAVLDAHVFAAFKNLSKVAVGGDIYVYMASGKRLHYVVTKARVFALSKLSPAALFTPTTAKQLNLITCAGQLTADHTTYTHRLIVSAKLV